MDSQLIQELKELARTEVNTKTPKWSGRLNSDSFDSFVEGKYSGKVALARQILDKLGIPYSGDDCGQKTVDI